MLTDSQKTAPPLAASGRGGLVVWFTGLPSSGKSTLAARVAGELRTAGVAVALLDGDEVRAALRPAPGYDEAGRDAFYETLARLAGLLAAQGQVVLVPATAHRRAFRARAQALAPAFLEVWVDTPLQECMRRDSKGLYERARTGQSFLMPGYNLEFEPPESPAVVARFGDPDALPAIRARILG